MQTIKQWWRSTWGGFAAKHPTAAKWIYQIFFFIVFCEGVTIFQYFIYAFMPGWLGPELAGVAWSWPALPMHHLAWTLHGMLWAMM